MNRHEHEQQKRHVQHDPCPVPCLAVAIVPFFVLLLLLLVLVGLGAGKRPENGELWGLTVIEVEVEVEVVVLPPRTLLSLAVAVAEGGARAVVGGCVSQRPRSSGEEERRLHASECDESHPEGDVMHCTVTYNMEAGWAPKVQA